jgi:hypothetical protein
MDLASTIVDYDLYIRPKSERGYPDWDCSCNDVRDRFGIAEGWTKQIWKSTEVYFPPEL